MSDSPAAHAALLRLDCLDRALKMQWDETATVIAAAQRFYEFVLSDDAGDGKGLSDTQVAQVAEIVTAADNDQREQFDAMLRRPVV